MHCTCISHKNWNWQFGISAIGAYLQLSLLSNGPCRECAAFTACVFEHVSQGPGKNLEVPRYLSVAVTKCDLSAVQYFPAFGLFNHTMSCITVSKNNIAFLTAKYHVTTLRNNWHPLLHRGWIAWQTFFNICTLDAMPG